MNEGRTTVIAREIGTDKIGVIPVRILENSEIEPMVRTNGSHTVMLKVDGTVWSYGIGEYGELGRGEKETKDEPVQVVFPNGTKIIEVASGENHGIALDREGNVWAWGRNQYYQLGNSDIDMTESPIKVSGLSKIRKIGSGSNTSFAIGSQGEVYSFGLNASGEGGIGSYTNKIKVTRAKNITGVIDIKAGKNHTVALKSNGEVYVTGSNLYGELGQNDENIRKVKEFTKVESLKDIVQIGVGDSTVQALTIEGEVYTWGSNIYKELGIGSESISSRKPNKSR